MDLFIPIAHAQTTLSPFATQLLDKIYTYILNPIILLIFAVAVTVFFYGLFRFIRAGENPQEREIGKQNMLWGIIGMTIMVSTFGILNLIAGTVGNTEVQNQIRASGG